LVTMLSDELLLLVFRKMAWKELRVTCMPVCRWWCEVARDASLWRELCRSRFPAAQYQTEQGGRATDWPAAFQEKQTELVRDVDKKLLCHYDICAKKQRDWWQGVTKDRSRVLVAIEQVNYLSYSRTALATFKKAVTLQALGRHPNIVTLVDVLGSDDEHLDSCWVIYRHMDASLDCIIRASILEEIHIQYITYQLLLAVRHVHSASIAHCDIQPSSILVNENCTIALSGFSEHAVVVPAGESPPQDRYVFRKWYSPPERVVGSTVLKCSQDMWQVGLVLGEMLKGQPLLPGNSTMHQLELICALTNPSADDVAAIESPYAETMVESIPGGGGGGGACRSLEEACPNASQSAIDLLRRLLQFNPTKRLTVAEALAHPYLAEFWMHEKSAALEGVHPWLVHGVPHDEKPPGIRRELLDHIRKWKQKKARKEEKRRVRRGERNKEQET